MFSWPTPLPAPNRQAASTLATVIFYVVVNVALASAGEFNPTLNIGDTISGWKDVWGTDEKRHSLDELKDKACVVVVFSCHSCPTAVDYEERLIELGKKFSANSGVALVVINPNKVADDLPEKMSEHAKRKNYSFLYLHDETQQIAKSFGATYTPEAFVLNKNRQVVYMGAVDDSTDPKQVKVKYVEDAVAAALAGKPAPKAETVARGCTVRYVRERRKSGT